MLLCTGGGSNTSRKFKGNTYLIKQWSRFVVITKYSDWNSINSASYTKGLENATRPWRTFVKTFRNKGNIKLMSCFYSRVRQELSFSFTDTPSMSTPGVSSPSMTPGMSSLSMTPSLSSHLSVSTVSLPPSYEEATQQQSGYGSVSSLNSGTQIPVQSLPSPPAYDVKMTHSSTGRATPV